MRFLKKNTTDRFLSELNSLLVKAKENMLISRDKFNYMFNPHPTIATLNALPKIHKEVRLIPGQPIVSVITNYNYIKF